MPNKYETLLANNLPQFMARYAIKVNGGSVQPLATPNPTGQTTLAEEFGRIGFQTSQRQHPKPPGNRTTGISLDAPLLTATVEKTRGRSNKDMLPFSRATVEVKFQAYQAGVGVPVYLIPYQGGKSRGVKLPAHGGDALATVFAMTATQNGCTVEVSGPAASPYASHTNVVDVSTGDALRKFQARRQKMYGRLEKLQQRFSDAEAASGGDAGAPAASRRQFGFYPPMVGDDGPLVEQVNYAEIGRRLVRARDGVYTLVRTVLNPGPGVNRLDYVACLEPGSVQNNTDPLAPPNAILMGVRGVAGWSFHYQVYTSATFVLQTIEDGKMSTLRPVLELGKPKRFDCTLILDHGTFWPGRTSNPLWT